MDIGTIGGIVVGLALLVWGILSGGSGMGDFIDPGSIVIVVGGTFSAIFVAFPMSNVLGIGGILGKAIGNAPNNAGEIITKVIDLANVARREGLLALEEAVDQVNDDFLKKGVMLIVDGTDPELVKSILETELAYITGRHSSGKKMFDVLGSFGPAFGMIGTLIGLVAMLNALDDPSSIGPAMAVALLTTFYGSVLANLFFIPIANKLDVKSGEELLVREIMIEGLLSIQAGENPRIIEEKLKAFLSPKVRKTLSATEDGGRDE
ncbi:MULTISPECIES: motility protein A [unclassified Fusibacter]|uniref:motility protein A n=1 Tax=unclassified Fusibacter TaxID=2624464 RepID=UPI00101116DF|nr:MULTISPECIES: MotA/TolQ/ExbB proton channel family protein [unclassified Fusibacter]MCK8058765.1 MotA/TolQ/ExbB proton channel family protein [Fusibacter sp. A2]NPE21839.1 motility protein A [Fusibacter sp. A1]RXV61411.1 motility protein A [Fusibacter sp. A1]